MLFLSTIDILSLPIRRFTYLVMRIYIFTLVACLSYTSLPNIYIYIVQSRFLWHFAKASFANIPSVLNDLFRLYFSNIATRSLSCYILDILLSFKIFFPTLFLIIFTWRRCHALNMCCGLYRIHFSIIFANIFMNKCDFSIMFRVILNHTLCYIIFHSTFITRFKVKLSQLIKLGNCQRFQVQNEKLRNNEECCNKQALVQKSNQRSSKNGARFAKTYLNVFNQNFYKQSSTRINAFKATMFQQNVYYVRLRIFQDGSFESTFFSTGYSLIGKKSFYLCNLPSIYWKNAKRDFLYSFYL